MKIVVVEDEKKYNETITSIGRQVLHNRNINNEIISFYDYTSDLKKIIFSKEVNIYLLDIQLPTKNGHDIARMIRYDAHDWESIIIICSIHNMKETFISKCLMILSYVSKFDDYEFNIADRINTALDILNYNGYITIKNDNIITNDILYIEKEKNSKYCTIQTFNDKFRVRKSLSQLENELNIKRTNKYLLLNNKNVISILNDKVIFKNNQEFRFK